jgi:hypothetical protein
MVIKVAKTNIVSLHLSFDDAKIKTLIYASILFQISVGQGFPKFGDA